MILLLSAVAQENTRLRAELHQTQTYTCGTLEYHRGILGAHNVAIATTGIGTANAAGSSALLLHQLNPAAVIVCGCGGAYHSSALTVGDLALASAEIYADTGAITPDGFLSMQALNLPLLKRGDTLYYNRFPVCTGLNAHAALHLKRFAAHSGISFCEGNFVSVATCSGTDTRAAAVEAATAGICENMEGAAIAQMCCMFDTPFVEVRAISNMVETRNMACWDLAGAMQRAQEALLFWLRHAPAKIFTSQEF
ncbi:MAG: futalosine hydrolase [Desulfuromonadaceae bacterium]